MRICALVSNSILSLLLAFACAAQAVEKPAEPIKLDFAWNLSLDAQGHVVQLTAIANKRADSVPQIRERIEQTIRSWAFVSGTVDGHPAPTETRLSVSISLLPNDENSYRIAFDDVRTGGHILKATPPHYPASAVHDHRTGMVVLRVDYDANGNALSATLDPGAPPVDKRLINASIDEVMRTWKFQPELVDGHGVPGTQVLPVCYALLDVPAHPSDGDVAQACQWNPPGKHVAIGQGDSLAVNPVAHLANDVAGHAL
jgi:TonB family protein